MNTQNYDASKSYNGGNPTYPQQPGPAGANAMYPQQQPPMSQLGPAGANQMYPQQNSPMPQPGPAGANPMNPQQPPLQQPGPSGANPMYPQQNSPMPQPGPAGANQMYPQQPSLGGISPAPTGIQQLRIFYLPWDTSKFDNYCATVNDYAKICGPDATIEYILQTWGMERDKWANMWIVKYSRNARYSVNPPQQQKIFYRPWNNAKTETFTNEVNDFALTCGDGTTISYKLISWGAANADWANLWIVNFYARN